LLNVSLALNQANFAAKYNIASGAAWQVQFKACN